MSSLAKRLASSKFKPQPIRQKDIPFGEWLPDLPALNNPGAITAQNVIPQGRSYRPMEGFSAIGSSALTARCRGAIAARDNDGNVFVYSGDETKLYSLVAQIQTDISRSAGYDCGDDSYWEFVQYQNTVVATNYDDPVQSIAPGGAVFADHITSTNKPKFRTIAVIGNFLVGGNSNDTTDGQKPFRVWWSGIDAIANFDPAASTQSDYQDLTEGGHVMRIIGGRDYGLVFCERMIYRMDYVGPPLVFAFRPIDRRRGTPIPGSPIDVGGLYFFFSEEGPCVTNGAATVLLGTDKVDHYFWDQFDIANYTRVSAALDPVNKCIFWAFPGTGSSSGTPNLMLCYNVEGNRFSEISASVQILVRSATQGYTLEELDTFGNMDTLPYSLDSRAWMGGKQVLAGFNTSNIYGHFTGANLAAVLDTGEIQLMPGRRSRLTKIRPLVDGGTITGQVASRVRQTDSVTFDSAGSLNTNGEISVNNSGQFHRARVNVAAGGTWTHAQGVRALYSPSSRR